MKKVIFLFSLFISLSSIAQTIFSERKISVPQKDMSSFLDLNDNYFGDIEFKSGGLVIDWIRIGSGDFNVRVVRYGDMNNWGIQTELSEYEGPNFWSRRNQHVEDFGPSFAGTSVFRQGDGSKHNTQQRWYLKVENPEEFMKAFKTFLKDNKDVFGDRWISVAAYTVGNPNGATHSVAMSGESWVELEQIRAKIFANGSAEKFLSSRGKVEDLHNELHVRMRHYNNERNKTKTYDDMW
ncbi:hypothetical protein EB155_05240 [archaeon]|nr:hypothetical protein [archaeon]